MLREMTQRIKCIKGFKIGKNLPGDNLCTLYTEAMLRSTAKRGRTIVQYNDRKLHFYPRASNNGKPTQDHTMFIFYPILI